MKRTILSLLLSLCVLSAWAAPDKKASRKTAKDTIGYRITFTIYGGTDSVMYMGNYYAGGTYAIDTARISKNGMFVFEKKDRKIMPGMYFFTNPSGKHVDFVVYHEKPDFSFETEEGVWSDHMKAKGSKENDLFFHYHKLNGQTFDRIDSLSKLKLDEATMKARRSQLLRQLDSVKLQLIEANPHSALALFMNATREPSVPTTDDKGNKLNDRQRWEYYMDHYFDHMNLGDDAMVRTPEAVFHKRVTDYLDHNLKGATPELVCQYVDSLIERSRPSKEVFKYLVHTITEKYLQSPIMSYDAVYVHLVKKYYASDDNFWSSPSVIDEQVKRANTWDRLLIGREAPELILRDMQGNIHSMHALNHKYTLLVFWSPTCGHCKTMIPELYQKYILYRDRCDIAAFAILSEPDENIRPKWFNFIDQHHLDWLNLDGGEANIDWHEVYDIVSTPQIYLLDKDKKILAKKLNADSFEMVIKALEGME